MPMYAVGHPSLVLVRECNSRLSVSHEQQLKTAVSRSQSSFRDSTRAKTTRRRRTSTDTLLLEFVPQTDQAANLCSKGVGCLCR